jgi:hypothetical protein
MGPDGSAAGVGAAREPSSRPAGGLDGIFGLRIVARWGLDRSLRTLVLFFWIGSLVNVIAQTNPDLLYPSSLGSDTSNYVAFGERLRDGHAFYALSPGDRPAPADNPPAWSVPILSPPQTAVPWAILSALPAVMPFYLPWFLGMAGTIALGTCFILRAPRLAVLASIPILHGLAVTALSGNVNALIGSAAVLACWAGQPTTGRRGVAAIAALTAALSIIKFGPIFIWLWLVGRRGRDALIAGAITVAVLTGAVLVAGGLAPFTAYLQTSFASATEPTPYSVVGLLIGLGMRPDLARLIWIVVVGLLVVLTVSLSRRRPETAFVAAVVGMVFLTPVVRLESVSLLVAAGSPWIIRGGLGGLRVPAIGSAAAAGLVAVASIATGGLATSSMLIENATDQPVIVRFGAALQEASWGYLVNPGQAGVAWSDQVGGPTYPLRAFDIDCAPLGVLVPDRTGGSLRIEGDSIVPVAGLAATDVLPYDARCAAQMPRVGVPGD